MQSYDKFAKFYDELMYDVDYEEWYRFIKDISDGSYRKVLEMACGTGNITEQLCEDDDVAHVTCFDLSEEMLIEANQKLKKYPNVKILKQDMVSINMRDQKYDLVLCACDGMNYILENESLKKVFENAYELLEDDGQFIFDMNSYNKLKNTIGNNTFVDENENVFYVWENEYDEDSDVCGFYLTFFVKQENGSYERFDEVHHERAYKAEYVTGLLSQVGFGQVKIHCDFEKSSAETCDETEAERVFFVCRKATC